MLDKNTLKSYNPSQVYVVFFPTKSQLKTMSCVVFVAIFFLFYFNPLFVTICPETFSNLCVNSVRVM
jgi:hypothetical protein